ncbi:hypothetical protein CPLU01_01393 [Colletotrichum plurivorum]|uniref:Uncharacterized protein n=1 Tax=Colletotrichum plurivorum TaxID=2175906 RepID=A0A8H6NPE4_9PEZI|nr:hypothetical protein CPLU01_01393 [Colletotrichum plurivorum]
MAEEENSPDLSGDPGSPAESEFTDQMDEDEDSSDSHEDPVSPVVREFTYQMIEDSSDLSSDPGSPHPKQPELPPYEADGFGPHAEFEFTYEMAQDDDSSDIFGDPGSPYDQPELPPYEPDGFGSPTPGIIVAHGRARTSNARDDPDYPRPSIEAYDLMFEPGGQDDDDSMRSLFSGPSEPQSSSTVKPDEDQGGVVAEQKTKTAAKPAEGQKNVVSEKQVKTADKPGNGQNTTRRKRKNPPPPPYKDSNELWVTFKSSQMFRPRAPKPESKTVPLPEGQPHTSWHALPPYTGACGLCDVRALFTAIHQRCDNCEAIICRNCVRDGLMEKFPNHPNIDVSQFDWGKMKPSSRRSWAEKQEREAQERERERQERERAERIARGQRYTPEYQDGYLSPSVTPSAPSKFYPPSDDDDDDDEDYDDGNDDGMDSSDDDYRAPRASRAASKRKRSPSPEVPTQQRPFVFERPSPITLERPSPVTVARPSPITNESPSSIAIERPSPFTIAPGLANSRPVRTSSINTYERMRGTANTQSGAPASAARQQPDASSGGRAQQLGNNSQQNDSSSGNGDKRENIQPASSPSSDSGGFAPPQYTYQPCQTNYPIVIENAVGVNRLEPAELQMVRFNLVLATLAKHVQGLHKKDLEDAARARRNKQRLPEVVAIETHLYNVVATFWHRHPAPRTPRAPSTKSTLSDSCVPTSISRSESLSPSTIPLSCVGLITPRSRSRTVRYKDHIPFMMRIMNSMLP